MGRFRYRLQVALDHALTLEREAKAVVASAAAALDGELAALAAADAALDAAAAKFHVRGAVVAYEIVEFARHLEFAERAVKRQRDKVAQARRRLAQARAELAPLAQRRAALEQHKERKREEWLVLEERAEAAELDEANILRAVTILA